MIKKTFVRKVDKKDLLGCYLRTFNGLMGLTKKELVILEQGIRNINSESFLFSGKATRNLISGNIDITIYNLGNVISKLAKKGIIIKGKGGYVLNQHLQLNNIDLSQDIEITFKLLPV